MKALSIFCLLILSSLAFAQKVEFPKDIIDVKVHKSLSARLFEDVGDKYKPEDIEKELFELVDSLYLSGVIKLSSYNEYKCKFEVLKKINSIDKANTDSRKHKCYKNYMAYMLDLKTCDKTLTFQKVFPTKNYNGPNPQYFENRFKCEGEFTSISTPFGGTIHPDAPKNLDSNDNAEDIFRNTIKNNSSKRLFYNLYRALYTSFVQRVKNDTAEKVSEYDMATTKQCKSGLMRLPFANFNPQNSCKTASNSCTKHEDCCSQSCNILEGETQGKCSEEFSCYKLIETGKQCAKLPNGRVNPYCDNAQMRHFMDPDRYPKPDPNDKITSCIEINYNTSDIGECTPAGGRPTGASPCCSDKVEAGKCVENFRCEICYRGGELLPQGQKCCPGYYKSLKGRCIQDFPILEMPQTSIKKKSIFEKVVAILIPSAHAQTNAPAEEGDNFQPTTTAPPAGTTSTQPTGNTDDNGLTADEKETFNTARKNCIDSFDHNSDELKKCLSDVSGQESALISDRLVNGENSGQMTREEYIKKFNRAVLIDKIGSNFEKCEFHSYNDNWNSGSDLFRNAELVLRGFEYVHTGQGTQDYWFAHEGSAKGKSIFERAKAIALKLRQNRSDLIKKYDEIDAEMTQKCKELYTEIKWKDKEQAQGTGEQGSSTATDKNEKNDDIAKGASGIKYTRLMMEFTRLRSEAQMVHFNNNANVEAELEELSQFLVNNKWEQSRTHQEAIFQFTIKEKRGFWKALVAIGRFLVTPFAFAIDMLRFVTFQRGDFWQTVNNLWGRNNSTSQEYTAGLMQKSMYGDLTRKMEARYVRTRRKTWRYRYKVYEWVYSSPYTDASNKDYSEMWPGATNARQENICRVYASSRMCLKNISKTEFKQDGSDVEEARFLLDLKVPDFVTKRDLGIADGSNNTNFTGRVGKIFKARQTALAAIRARNPRRDQRESYKDRTNFLHDPRIAPLFIPGGSKWVPNRFDENMKKAFIRGAMKYALCGNDGRTLTECGSQNAKVGDEGFGRLISTEADAKAFADYTFQHHFKWPSLTPSNSMGYPTMATSSYFQAVAHYLRVVGSLAATKSMDFGDLADKYENYLTDLEGEYNTGTKGYQGSGSQNVDYSPKFFKEFRKLDFTGNSQNVDGLTGKNGDIVVPEGFNSAESAAFIAGARKAIRAAGIKKAADHYKKTAGSTERGKLKIQKQKNFVNRFGRPVDGLSSSLRQGLKNSPLANSNSNSLSATEASTKDGSSQNSIAAYQPPKIDNYNYNANNFGNNSSYSNDNSNSGSEGESRRGVISDSKDKGHQSLLDGVKKMRGDLIRSDDDSIFKIVTKAYFRNLDLILERKNEMQSVKGIEEKTLDYQRKEDKISNDKKAELRKLLSQ